MSIRYLDLSGAVNFWTNIKNYVLSKIPTKTSELTNDSGFLTQHQSLSNYVTLNSEQTITGKKLFTNSTTKVNSVNTFTGSTQFIDLSTTVPRGAFPAEDHRVGRIYIGDSTSYNGAWFIVDPIISTNKAVYRMVTTSPDNSDSTRFSITWDSTETGARCRKNVSTGDLLPYANNTYNLGSNNQKWDIGYIHNLIGSNKEDLTEDANNYYSTTSGSHMTFYTTSNGGTKLSNVPAAVNTHLESRTIRYLSSSDWIVEQICHNSFGLYYRKGTNGTWEDWKTFAFTNSNITGKASNVTGTVAIANGGTGATTRLNAVKALTNESVDSPTHFLTITTNWKKAGYTTVAQAKTVLGITGDMGSHSDSEYVHKTGDESITGTKTFGNGTLIVDNGTGNNVHGEIKLNGTRPVYINADNSEDGLFANTACGMSIILNDSSKSIHIGGYTTNSSGRKLIKTADKAPYLTLGTQEVGTQILVPENDTADSSFSITSTLKYASGASAKSFTVKFKQGDDGSSGVFPVANNKTDLGLSGNRWKNVYATNYYYGADAVEFSTKFVTTDTNQVISGSKTFASSPLIYNSDATGSVPQITFKNSKTTKGSTTETGAQLIYFTDKNDAPLSMIESRVVSNGCTTLSTVAYNFNDSQNVSSSVQLIKNPTTAYYAPGADNDISLGRASARWLGVYATNYYYGSDNVEFSTKFVTTDTAQTITGVKTLNNDTLVANLGNAYRIANSAGTGYGVFQRVDNVNWYLMVTAQNDALGSWTSARPASMNLSTGVLSINGNSATATEFSANKSVTLTGDVTGTASSKAGWTVSTTLANSGVSAGTYTNVTVDAKGRVTSGNARHSYTVTSTSKAWFRLANATSSPLDTNNPPHVQFILRAYNTSLGAQYYQEWIVDAKVFGSQSGLQIFGSSGSPFQYGRILYEATTSSVTNETKPCIDIYLNSTSRYATNIEIIELYNTGFEFVSGNTLSVSSTPSGFESRQVAIVQSGVSNSDWANYATRTQINRSDISSDITLADTNTYKGTCLNCTNNLTINVPSLNSALCWFIIKNVTNDKKVTIHPTTGVTIDGSNNDIVLRPKESITILSRSSNNFIIINDNRRRTAVVGRTVAATGATKHWFLVAETTVSFGYADIYASFKVFKASGTYQASGILSLHVRVDSTIGVSSSRQLQWEYNNDTSTLPLENFAITTTETSGDNIKVQLWYKGEGSYASCKFVMLAEQGASEYLDNPIWKLTRFRKSTADGDMETLDTGFTTTTYSSLMPIVNPIPAIDTCVKNVVTNNQTIKSTGITRGTAPSSAQTFGIAFSDNNGKYIGNVYGYYATDKASFVGLYAYKGTTTSNSDNVSVRVGYDASGNAYTYAPTPATADNSTQIATTAFVKAQGYLTSHQSLANYVTTNTDQSISGIKSHSKHISILGDYVGNEASTNGRSCLYLKANRDTDGKSGVYITKFRQNVAQGNMGSSDVVFLSHDILENETRTNAGFVESYSNWANDVPGGMSIYSSIATRNLGTSAKPWTNAYITNLNLNGHVFDPASVSGNIGDIVFASAYYSSIVGTADLGLTVSGDALYLAGFDNNTLNVDSTASSLAGTWKFLGIGKPTTTSGNADTKRVGLWKRIA